MSDYIDIKKLKKKKVYSFQTVFGAFPKNEWFYKYDDIHSIPTADVRENIHGHWKKAEKGITAGEFSYLFKCSCCNYELYDNEFNFCPHCGADMRESKGEKGKT